MAEAPTAEVPAKVGRPGKFSPEVVDRICERFALGIPLKMACEGEGVAEINEASFRRHLQRNPQFVQSFRAAKTKYLHHAMSSIGFNADWRAKAWLLERRYPDMFSKPPDAAISVSQSNVNAVTVLPADVVKGARDYYEQRNGKLD